MRVNHKLTIDVVVSEYPGVATGASIAVTAWLDRKILAQIFDAVAEPPQEVATWLYTNLAVAGAGVVRQLSLDLVNGDESLIQDLSHPVDPR